jgi:hypothetical protein
MSGINFIRLQNLYQKHKAYRFSKTQLGNYFMFSFLLYSVDANVNL